MSLKSKNFYGHFIRQPIFAKDLFGNLPSVTEKKLASIKQREEINEGEIISKIGSFPENIYVIVKGKAQMILPNELNRKKKIRLIENEEIIGLTQSLSGSPCEMSVVALSPCSLDAFRAEDFLNFLKDEPQVCFRLAKRLSQNIEADYKTFASMIF